MRNGPRERLLREGVEIYTNSRGQDAYRCPYCNDEVRVVNKVGHERSLPCQAEQRQACLRKAELRRAAGSFQKQVLQAAGVCQEHLTSFERHSKGRKARLVMESWAPEWAVAVTAEEWKLTEGFEYSEALAPFVDLIKRMRDDEETRDAVFTAKRLFGPEGVRRLVFTPKMRATKIRRAAQELLSKAAKLQREADEIDPPEITEGESQ